MPAVDFHVVDETSAGRVLLALSRIVAALWAEGHRLYIHTASAQQADEVDAALWTYQDISFVPHARLGDPLAEATPILIGERPPPSAENEILVNLAHPAPEFYEQFQRVIEIAGGAPEARTQARERYRFYRDRGCELTTHGAPAPARTR
jgi:DNA polymerase-3 subunit chi